MKVSDDCWVWETNCTKTTDTVIVVSSYLSLLVIFICIQWGVPKIHVVSVVGSKTGLEQIAKDHPDVEITVGAVDDTVTEDGVLLPGLGDAGDRLFGTPLLDDEEALLHPSKRKRSDAGL